MDEGKLIGFIVSKNGMQNEPDKIEVIAKIPPPHNKISIQSFLQKINFII
jgi:hypothetical protein